MIKENSNTRAFLELIRAGLWEKDVELQLFGAIDFSEIYRIAEEQSVVGLVAAGLEHVGDVKVPQLWALQVAGQTMQIEQRNKELNDFVGNLVKRLLLEGVHCLLVKGQGVAQCYERPLWRACGDVDLLLSNDNYDKAKSFLTPLADEVADENERSKHQALVISGFGVELHGKMPFALSRRADKEIDDVLDDLFCRGNVRSWDCCGTQVFLPSADNDVILVFTHFLHHFFIEGVGLRQICDWCRLLYTYRDSLNYGLLESRIRRMGMLTEWKAFASLAVDTLGMPVEAMPFYDVRYKKKGERILERILKCGNFGHNNDLSYRARYSGITYKLVAVWRRFVDFASLVPAFPVDAPRFFVGYMFGKVK